MQSDDRQAVPSDRDLLLRCVRERKAWCPRCRGDLAEMRVTECPTCGQSLKLCLQTAEPYSRAWLTLTAVLALSAGVGLFVFLVLLLFGESPFPGGGSWTADAESFYMMSIPLTIAAILWRRRFNKWSAQAQWQVAALAAIVAALAFAVVVRSFLPPFL